VAAAPSVPTSTTQAKNTAPQCGVMQCAQGDPCCRGGDAAPPVAPKKPARG
jgi:hypothetical protein